MRLRAHSGLSIGPAGLRPKAMGNYWNIPVLWVANPLVAGWSPATPPSIRGRYRDRGGVGQLAAIRKITTSHLKCSQPARRSTRPLGRVPPRARLGVLKGQPIVGGKHLGGIAPPSAVLTTPQYHLVRNVGGDALPSRDEL